MCASVAPSTPQLRLAPDAAAVEVQALYRGVVIGSRCLLSDDAAAAFRIGSAKGVDAPAPPELLSVAAHALVSSDARGFTIDLTERMTGTVLFEDRSVGLEDLRRAHGPQFVPPPTARLQIACGDVAFLVSPTTAPLPLPRPPLARMRNHWPALAALAGVLALLGLLAFLPPDAMVVSGDTIEMQRIWAIATRIPPVVPQGAAALPAPAGGAPGKAAPAGPSASRRAPPSRRVASRPRASTPDDPARGTLLGVLLRSDGEAWNTVFSRDSALADGAADVLGELSAVDLASAGSVGGLRQTGGGGGPRGTLAGIDEGRTLGTCVGACLERARDAARLAPRRIRPVEVTIGQPVVRGSLDREIVRRTIRRHINEVKYCYEQALPRHPNLAGRVTVQFAIASAGGNVVTSAVQSSTAGNASVENCIAQAVRRWEFPRQNGGGLVVVSYPFVLVPAGGSL